MKNIEEKNNSFKIGSETIGHKYVYIIAEACDNHLGNMDVAEKMVIEAKKAGADCIKFQHHLPDEEMLPDTPMSSNFEEPLYDFLKKYALTIEQHSKLIEICKNNNIQYLCTPFSYKAAEELAKDGVSCEVIDLRSVRPIDYEAIVSSVKKTNRCVVVEESWPLASISGEIAYHLQRHAFDYLDAPVMRVMQVDTPFAFSKVLIDEALPSIKKIIDAVKSSLYVS